jgi:hypothetical protein
MRSVVPRAIPALVLGSVLAALAAGCTAQGAPAASPDEPAHVEEIEGSELKLVRLTPEAAGRLGIATTQSVADGTGIVVPYGAIFYDPKGAAWVYVEGAPLEYVRQEVSVDAIEGDLARLTEGPEAGSSVVSTGVAELYGTEFEVGH